MSDGLVVHMIANSHLDPVWLWHWQRGSDEALATCRAACDLIDDHPALVFTRGEAWAYEQVRSLDPGLFERVKRHAEAGRWEVANGWWVQADVNLPTVEAVLKSIELGHAWFREHMGIESVPVAYNVDSFGHGAYLPSMLARAGQRYYVMMRPQEHEKKLPSSLFRWRSPDGAEVLTFRIIGGYGCEARWLEGHVRGAVDRAPEGVGHVMCFYGVGDHGGGPTRASVEWILEHRDFAPGVHLEFSSPSRFFKEAERHRERMPVVEGELQYHAIGCYSVCGALKRDIRAAELAAADAGRLADATGGDLAAERASLRRAWEHVCFNQFHDVLPGSSVPSAIEAARAQIGAARTEIERATHAMLRGRSGVAAGCDLEGQRIHFVNRSPGAWRGLAEIEPWTDWRRWEHRLEDARGKAVPHQRAEAEALMLDNDGISRVLVSLELAPGGSASFRLVHDPAFVAERLEGDPAFADGALSNGLLKVRFAKEGVSGVEDERSGVALLAGPVVLECIEDLSDTWSHDIDRYAGRVLARAEFGAAVEVESGPLRATVRLDGGIGGSEAMLFASLCRGEAVVHLRLHTNYRERMTVLKARIAPAGGIEARRDRVAGGWIDRATDGREYPLHHATRVAGPAGALGVSAPDSFAVECTAKAVRPTLVRNTLNALHNGSRKDLATIPRRVERFGTDEGPQEVRVSVAFGDEATEAGLERLVDVHQRPPWAWDDYRGGARLARFGG